MAYTISGAALSKNRTSFKPDKDAIRGNEISPKSEGPKAGSGKFAALEHKLGAEKTKGGKKKVSNPAALAAFIGRKKYGEAAMARASAQGRKRA